MGLERFLLCVSPRLLCGLFVLTLASVNGFAEEPNCEDLCREAAQEAFFMCRENGAEGDDCEAVYVAVLH